MGWSFLCSLFECSSGVRRAPTVECREDVGCIVWGGTVNAVGMALTRDPCRLTREGLVPSDWKLFAWWHKWNLL